MPHAEVYRAPLKENPSANRFRDARNRAGAAIWSLFGHAEIFTDDESFEYEYDPDTVDLLDVVGKYEQPRLKASRLTLFRLRSIYTFYTHKYPKFTLHTFTRQTS